MYRSVSAEKLTVEPYSLGIHRCGDVMETVDEFAHEDRLFLALS